MENEFRSVQCPTEEVSIYVAGDIQIARWVCQQFVMQQSRCVTITPTTFVYAGGTEEGVIVAFRAYPRFPPNKNDLLNLALCLTEKLVTELGQWSAMIVTSETTYWFTRRKEETPGGAGGGVSSGQ